MATWDESKWLVASSFSFVAPGLYAYANGHTVDCALLVLTSVISANFWRDARVGWRRSLDLAYAKFIFTVYVSRGVYYVRYVPYMVIGYPGLAVLSYCFHQSDRRHRLGKGDWYWYHCMFHVLMTCELFMIVDSIVAYSRNA